MSNMILYLSGKRCYLLFVRYLGLLIVLFIALLGIVSGCENANAREELVDLSRTIDNMEGMR